MDSLRLLGLEKGKKKTLQHACHFWISAGSLLSFEPKQCTVSCLREAASPLPCLIHPRDSSRKRFNAVVRLSERWRAGADFSECNEMDSKPPHNTSTLLLRSWKNNLSLGKPQKKGRIQEKSPKPVTPPGTFRYPNVTLVHQNPRLPSPPTPSP